MLKLKKVWIADNGDIFLEREVDYREATQKEIEELKNQALEALDRGEFECCHYEEGKTKYGKYYSQDGEFLGNEQIHILTKYKVWDHEKQDVWLRPKEKDSIKQPTWNVNKQTIANKKKGFGFYDALDNFQLTYENTAYLIGLRASESLNRWRAVIKNPGISNIYWSTKRPQGNFQMYPLYDWNFQDIWKFLYENNIRYSKIYDYQYKKGLGMKDMRVSSLIHERAFKSLVELPEFEPQTYDKLMARTKGIQVGNIYGKNDLMLKCRKLPKNYDNWIQYRDFLLSTIKDKSIK